MGEGLFQPLHILLIVGIALLVFILEPPRIFSRIAYAPFVLRGGNLLWRRAVAHNSLYLSTPKQSTVVRV